MQTEIADEYLNIYWE